MGLVSPASWTKLIDADGIKHIALQTSGSASLTNETFGAATDSNTVTYDITTMRSGDRATFTYSGVTVDNLIDTDVNTTLSSAITSNVATSISVTSATGIVIGSTLYIGAEQLTVTAIDGTTATLLTVTRASNGTLVATHGDGAAVSADGNASNADFQVLVSSDDTTTPALVTTDLDGVDAATGTTYVLPSALVIGAVADGSGTLTLADTEKTSAALEAEDRTFIYTAAAEMSGGSLQMIVPAGWSAPNEKKGERKQKKQ